jgi:hypothetical protein
MSNSQDIKLNEEYNKILRKYEINLFEKKKEKIVKSEIKIKIINPETDQTLTPELQTQEMQQMIDNINNNFITDLAQLNHINNLIQNYNINQNNIMNITVQIPPIPAHVFTDTNF